MVPYLASSANYANTNFNADQLEMGIPSNLLLDATLDAATALKILNEDVSSGPLYNFYYENTSNGDSVNPSATANSARELNEMTHWSIVAARRAWWTNDLAAAQSQYNTLSTSSGCAVNTDTSSSVSYTGCNAIDYTVLNTF